jgi:hypothetical protein
MLIGIYNGLECRRHMSPDAVGGTALSRVTRSLSSAQQDMVRVFRNVVSCLHSAVKSYFIYVYVLMDY